KAHHADVVTGIRIHRHQIPLHQLQTSAVAVEGFACVLESHLHAIERLNSGGQRHTCQPIEHAELVAAAGAAIPVALASGRFAVLAAATSCTSHSSWRSPSTLYSALFMERDAKIRVGG